MGYSSKRPKRPSECSFQPEHWDEVPGIDGPVMICNTHGLPGIGVYDFPPGEASGTCDREYDHSQPDWEQSNPLNPQLEAFRESGCDPFDWWHWLSSNYDKTTPPWRIKSTPDEIAHALKVLGLAHRVRYTL